MDGFLEHIDIITAFTVIVFCIITILIGLIVRRDKTFGIDIGRIVLETMPSFDVATVTESVKYYVKAYGQASDPFLSPNEKREELFKALDQFVFDDKDNKFVFIFGHSGSGKTTLLVNYALEFKIKPRKKYNIYLIPASSRNIQSSVDNIESHFKTVLLVDGLDEALSSEQELRDRIRSLITVSNSFHKLVITTRSPYYPFYPFYQNPKLPEPATVADQVKVQKSGPRNIGEKAHYGYLRFYISPFTDDQVRAYVEKRISLFNYRKRNEILQMLSEKVPDIKNNPLLLAGIFKLGLTENAISRYKLYDELINAYLERDVIEDKQRENLLRFYEELALEVAKNQSNRVNQEQLLEIGKRTNISVEREVIGIIVCDYRDRSFSFSYDSFADYFLSKYMLDNKVNEHDLGITKKAALKSFLQPPFYRTKVLP